MLTFILKIFFINIFAIYIISKIINYKLGEQHKKLLIILPFIMTLISYFLKLTYPELTYILSILLLWVILSIVTLEPKVSFVASTFAFGISYTMSIFTGTIALIFVFPLYPKESSFPYLLLVILSAFIQALLTFGLFRIRRLQKGMPFLFTTSVINIATLICLCLIAILAYQPIKQTNIQTRIFLIVIFVLAIAFLIHWWQAQITKSYKHSLQIRELESLRVELQEKDKVLSELKAQNEQIGRLIHHDNKRIPAMEHAVSEYLVSDFDDVETTKEKGEALLVEIRDLSASRTNTLAEIYAKKFTHYDTGISALDTILNYMNKRASQRNTDLSVHIAVSLEDYIPRIISSDDLTHILSDLLENALIATESCNNAAIQLQFYQSEKHFVVEVSDNGIPFTIDSFLNMGLSRLTTHADTGGSGIGLMDIWEIKEKYGATLHIEEFEQSEPFSKKISLVFNRKNLYSIRTWRSDEISKASKRNDLRIYEYGI